MRSYIGSTQPGGRKQDPDGGIGVATQRRFAMLVTNNTYQDYWFGPLHLPAGSGQQITVDDTSETSLYLLDDAVADAINSLYNAGKISVSGAAAPFPRPTGVPEVLHGDGEPEGLVYAPQGSVYLRRDGTGANSLYTKTTGVTLNTGWQSYTTEPLGPGTTYRKTTAKAVNTSTSATDLLNGEIMLAGGVMGTSGHLHAVLWGDFLQDTGASQTLPQFQLVIGGTVVLDTGDGSGGWTSGSTRVIWRVQIEALELGAVNSQLWRISGQLGPGDLSTYPSTWTGAAFVSGLGSYTPRSYGDEGETGPYVETFDGQATSSLDMTISKAFVFNVINGANSAAYETRLLGAFVEIL